MNKLFNYCLLIAVSSLVTSCFPGIYYQVQHVASPDAQLDQRKSSLVYEDADCVVMYNLWSEGGDPGFTFYNRTNENIYLDLSKTQFIKNSQAFDYFQNRTVTTHEKKKVVIAKTDDEKQDDKINAVIDILGGRTPRSTAKEKVYYVNYEVATKDAAIVCIPPHSFKMFNVYSIIDEPVDAIDIYPSNNSFPRKKFDEANSPVTFLNRMTYTVGKGNEKIISTRFYVSEIMSTRDANSIWGLKSPENFYISYPKITK